MLIRSPHIMLAALALPLFAAGIAVPDPADPLALFRGEPGPQGPQGEPGPQGPPGADGGVSKIAHLRDERPPGVHGGTCMQNVWTQRPLNTIEGDEGVASLDGTNLVLAPGKYSIRVDAPAYLVAFSKARLVATTGTMPTLYGTSIVSNPSGGSTAYTVINGQIVVNETTTFVIEQICSSTKMTYGFGIASGAHGPEIYTQVQIIKQ